MKRVMANVWRHPAGKAKAKRAPKRRLPPTATPNDCVILAIDTAKNSGWCLMVRGQYHSSGETGIMDHGKLVALIRNGSGVVMDAGLRSDKYVLVLERPFGGGEHQVEGLGAARHAWLSAWCDAHATKTPRRVVKVYQQTWRAALGIPLRGGRAGRTVIEVRMAHTVKWRGLHLAHMDAPQSDEAAAILIAKWAANAGEVAAALQPKPKKAKAA